jgi:HEAT repeat protein
MYLSWITRTMGETTMQKIIETLNNKASPERWQSVIALESMGKPAVEYLVHALKDDNKWVRFTAADALGNIGDPRSVDHLIGMLNDEDQDVRFATAEALGKLGDPKATDALKQTSIRDNGFVKIAAEETLAKIV